jgi:CRISPR-associated exonuclease Cas4
MDAMWAVIFLLVALVAWWMSRRVQRASGLPRGTVIYRDSGGWERTEQPLFSARLGLTGRPDYLVRERGGVTPVEVKSMATPPGGPHAAHVYQLAAYCALVQEAYGQRPRQGLIKYADQTLAVDFTPELERELSALLKEIHAAGGADNVERSHDSPARCGGCGFVEVCDEALN